MRTKFSDGAVLARPFLESLDGPLTFGRMLRSIRLGEEMTQEAFAERLGVPKQNLSAIENGRRGVSAARASEWAKTLGYLESEFVRLALQAELDAAGVMLEVTVAPVAPKRGKKKRAA